MSQKVWLLVEWLDENRLLPKYGIADTVKCKEDEVKPGQTIYLQSHRHGKSRKAQIIKISESKEVVQEHKAYLQRQDDQVQNVLALCMKTIKEIKQEPMAISSPSSSNYQPALGGGLNMNTSQIIANVEPETSGSDGETSSTDSENKTGCSDQGTQTESDYINIEAIDKCDEMERQINELYEEYRKIMNNSQELLRNLRCGNCDRVIDQDPEESENKECALQNFEIPKDASIQQRKLLKPQKRDSGPSKTLHVRRVSAHTTNDIEPPTIAERNSLVPIGKGNVSVPRRLLDEINWDEYYYTSATRRILQAVFPRKVLATHSLTGKPSPAFSHLPAKKRLDPKIVEDIITTVSERCGVPRALVRNAITVKCTDEGKLYRNRLQNKLNASRVSSANVENISPSPPSSVESHNNEATNE